ncbi:hypothetical protein EV426DRAFT_686533 [Tirmania nivea]|nr:hypothetical protein EV426DRAFT_686533 [Tirmania nivea]
MMSIRKDLFWVIFAVQPYPILAQASFQGDEFSNNLFSDLAPLLTLFGERVATQYLRHSTRRLESLIFACAPLGILTAVTSAIRVGGDRRLKALIGRAEEPEAVAEIELMSSTSVNVCELWNGVGLVRVVGKPQILELVVDEDNKHSSSGDTNEGGTKFLGHSYGIYTRKELVPERNDMSYRALQVEQSTIGSLESIAPNISLNTIGISTHEWETYLVALCGVILQLAVVAFEAMATYYFRWDKGGETVAKYAFPLTSIGTVGLVYGMYLCAYIIEISTEELTWKPEKNSQNENKKPKQLRIIWVQKSQTVGDQGFGSYAIYAPFTETASRCLLTSHRRQEKEFEVRLHKLTMVATALSIGAFILQFVGLRAMHYSASIVQLVATVIMTVLRVVIRRHISQPPKKLSASFNETPAPQTDTRSPGDVDEQQAQFQMSCHKDYAVQELTSGHELDVIALQLQRCRRWQILSYVESPPPQQPLQQPLHVAQRNAVVDKPSETLAQKVFGTRIRLSELVQSPWYTDHEIRDHAQKLSDTITDLTNFVWKLGDTPGDLLELEDEFSTKREISWNLLVEAQGASSEGPCQADLPLFVQRNQIEGQKWKPWEVDGSRVDALLHLWIQQLRTDNVDDGNMLWLLCPQGDDRASMIADWWIGRESCIVKGQELDEICREYSIVRSCGAAQGRLDKSRIVGCVGFHKDPRNKTSSMIPEAASGPVARAIIQNTTLINFTTQYILYTFLCKLVDSIARITPETQIEESIGQGTALLANKAVTELAHKIQERGLMGVADAYRMIVCALYAGGKLPLASSELPNAPSFFNIYNDALELGLRVKRIDIFHEAQEMCAIEVEWLLAQNRSEEAAILLIKAIQRCEAISLAGENKCRPGEENWVKGRLRGMMRNVADQFVSVIQKPVPSSSSTGTCTNATPAVPLMATPVNVGLSLEDAIRSNEVAVVHTLIKNGAMINESLNPVGAYPLDYAAREHHRDMITLLHLHGASTTRAPMCWAIEGGNARRSSEGNCLGVMKLLSELGSSPNIAEPHTGQLPLHVAARSNFAEVVAWLMTESGYDMSVGAGDKEGLTALHHAAKEGHASMVRLLIEVHHADINCGSTTDKKTALHHAAIRGDLSVLKMLCDQVGIDLEARCSEGKSALLYASQAGHYAIIEALYHYRKHGTAPGGNRRACGNDTAPTRQGCYFG